MKSTKIGLLGEILIIALLTLISLFLGLLPTIYRNWQTPPGRVFVGTEFYSDDYSIYVSNILQGQNGRWTLLDKHTSEPHQGTIIHDEYLLWGKLTSLFNINQIISYHLARFAFGFIFLFISYLLLLFLLPQSPLLRIITFIYLTLSGGFPIFNNNPDFMTKFHFSWLSEIDLINRTTVLPHYLLGYIFFLLCALFFLKLQTNTLKKQRNLFLFCMSGIFLGLIHPVELIIFYCILLIYLIILSMNKVILNKSKNVIYSFLYLIKPCFYIIIFLFFTSLVLLYYRWEFNIPPWTHMQTWENLTDYHPDFRFLKDYILAIGPTFFLAVLGLFSLINKKNVFPNGIASSRATFAPRNDTNVKLFLISWITSFFLLIFFSYPFLKISQVRLLQNPIFLPFSLLAGLGTISLVNILNKTLKIFVFKRNCDLSGLLCPLVISLVLLISLPTAIYSLQAKFSAYKDFSTLIYPTKEQIEGINYLKNNTGTDKVVLALYEAATVIPFWSGNTIYAGHLWATLNWPEKSKKAGLFYSGQMPEKQAKDFLINNRISYVFYGFQEQSANGNIEKYPFLKTVYENEKVKILKIR